MKSFRHLGLFLSAFVFLFSHLALANSTDQTKYYKEVNRVSLKCYVQFIGGRDSILYHYGLSTSKRASFEAWLLKSYSDLPGINESEKIYKVNECVEINRKFKSRIASHLEEKLKNER